MKAADFARFLRAAGDLTHDAGMAAVATSFEARPAATVAATVKTLPVGEPTLWRAPEVLVASLESLRPLAEAIGKAGVVKDIDAFIAALRRGPSGPARLRAASRTRKPSVPAASPERVAAYLRELTDALHDRSRFAEAFQRLSDDPSMGASEMKVIARDFARAPSKSRADALKRIFARHQNATGMDAKAKATGGRTAA
jgi:hypothetical protein